MRISLVIPVYNEADQIHDCLASVARQTVKPFEVIVVDNNSTDGTATLAANFPFVRVLHEPKQGVVYARDRGFDAAQGDVIARIDADTVLPEDWLATAQAVFTTTDADLITGSVRLRGICATKLASRVDLFFRRYLAGRLGSNIGLQGANMALRRTVWLATRGDVCHKQGIHEDFDIGLHAYKHGFRGIFTEELVAEVSHRQLDSGFKNFVQYALTSPRTYAAHKHKGGRYMYRVVLCVILLYPVIVLLSRGYDERFNQFSLSKLLFGAAKLRVNPATFVD